MYRADVPTTDDRSPSIGCSWFDAGAVLVDLPAIARA